MAKIEDDQPMNSAQQNRGPLRSFRDLEVYAMAREASGKIFVLSKHFPLEEKFAPTDQLRGSSRAVGALIAEAWARRRYKAAFINKLQRMIDRADTFCP